MAFSTKCATDFVFLCFSSRMQTSTASEFSSASGGGGGSGVSKAAPAPPIQDSYVQGLVQQIKLLELEINYLKQHAGGSGTNKDNLSPKKESVRSETVSPSSRSEKKVVIAAATAGASEDHHKRGIRDRDDDQIRNLRQELMHKNARLESVLAEKTQLSHRIKALEADYFFSVYLLKRTKMNAIDRCLPTVLHLYNVN